jgi:hypothetical protein
MSERVKEIVEKIRQGIPQLEKKENRRHYDQILKIGENLSNPDELISIYRRTLNHLEGEDLFETTIWNSSIIIEGENILFGSLFGDLEAEVIKEERLKELRK